MKKNIFVIGSTLLIGFVLFYLMLPPINVQSMAFWVFVILMLLIFSFVKGIFSISRIKLMVFNKMSNKPKGVIPITIISLLAIIVLLNIICSPLFNADSYSKRITVDETKEFVADIKEVDFNALPLLDKESSTKLGDRVMGQMPELVSQFYVSDKYTQINYNNDIIRVTPLEYDGLIKYFTNRKEGVKGYITVNSVNGETELIKLDKGMKYMESAFFGENLYRKLRFSYPTKIFGDANFEIDNEGNPYWIIPCIKYTAVELKRDVKGVIILDPITGDSKYYKVNEVPTWVDHVYNADMVIEQVNNWGKYRNGFFNSIFGQKNVVQTTEGYNYTTMNDDVYLYTGITSAAADESNIGFILTNLRTKETNYYASAGAEEYSAMGSAEGQVQQMKYQASFPLLINLNNRATYLISLKDNAGLVKMYAFVDVADYQKVVVSDASKGIKAAAENYVNNVSYETSSKDIEKTITIKSINTGNIEGTTYYYIVDNDDEKYRVSLKTNELLLPFLNKGDKVSVIYKKTSKINEITSIK